MFLTLSLKVINITIVLREIMNSIASSMIFMKPRDVTRLVHVDKERSKVYPEENFYLKMVSTDIYFDMVNNMEMKTDELPTLYGVKPHTTYTKLQKKQEVVSCTTYMVELKERFHRKS